MSKILVVSNVTELEAIGLSTAEQVVVDGYGLFQIESTAVSDFVDIFPATGGGFWKRVLPIVTGSSGYSGTRGPIGISGFSGYSGYSGYSGTNGKDGVNNRGVFLQGSTYNINDLVSYNGSAYTCISDSTTGDPITSPSRWAILASKGSSGYSGYSGYSGAGLSGYSGYSGTPGTSGISGYSGAQGSAGSSAGSNAQVQYNNSGGFGASSAFTWDNTNKIINVIKGAESYPAINVDRSGGDGDILSVIPISAGTWADRPLFKMFTTPPIANGDGTYNHPFWWGWFGGGAGENTVHYAMENNYTTQHWIENHLEVNLAASSEQIRLFSSTFVPGSSAAASANQWDFRSTSFNFMNMSSVVGLNVGSTGAGYGKLLFTGNGFNVEMGTDAANSFYIQPSGGGATLSMHNFGLVGLPAATFYPSQTAFSQLVSVSSLQTTGSSPGRTGVTRMVTTDEQGILGFQAIPSGGGGSQTLDDTTILGNISTASIGIGATPGTNALLVKRNNSDGGSTAAPFIQTYNSNATAATTGAADINISGMSMFSGNGAILGQFFSNYGDASSVLPALNRDGQYFLTRGDYPIIFGTGATTIERMSVSNSGVTINANSSAYTLPTGRGTNGYSLVTDGSGGTSWSLISSDFAVATAVNTANYTTTSATYVILSDLTGQANRTVTLPSSPVTGRIYIYKNKNNSSFTWTFAGGTVKDNGDNTITILDNLTVYNLIYDGSKFNINN